MNRFLSALLVVACSRESAPSPPIAATSAAPQVPSAAAAWRPHKLSKLDASTLCAELVEGKVVPECLPGGIVAVFLVPGRQRTEANGSIVSFNDGRGDFARWIADSLAGDAGVAPVYHDNASAKMLVSFNGDVPEETKLRVAEALDAL